MTIEIERGVPIHASKGSSANSMRGNIRKLAAADIGDSVFFPGVSCSSVNGGIQTIGPGWATIRKVDDGVRVWKIAEPKPR